MKKKHGKTKRRQPGTDHAFDVVKLGASLKAAREKQAVPLRAVAEKAGYSVTHISQIERGRTCPTIGALVRVARALGRDPAYFLEPGERPEVHQTGGSTPRRYRLRSGNSRLKVVWLSSGIAGGKLTAGRVTIDPRRKPGEMSELTVPTTHLCHVLKGQLVLLGKSGEARLTPGDAAVVQGGAAVRFFNPGPAPAELLCVLVDVRPHGTSAAEVRLRDAHETDDSEA